MKGSSNHGISLWPMMTAIKRDEVPMQAPRWTDLENTRIGEISQVQRRRFVRFHLYEIHQTGKFVQIESKLGVARGWGEEGPGNDH